MGTVKVIGSLQGFFLGTAAFIGKMPNALTSLGAVCIFIASVAGCKINLKFGATSFLVFILLSRAASVSRALKRKAIAEADPGEGPRGPAPPPLFLDQTEVRGAENFFLEGQDDRPAHPPPPGSATVLCRWKGKGKFVFNSVIKYDYR